MRHTIRIAAVIAVALAAACGSIVEPVPMCRGRELTNAADSTNRAVGSVIVPVPCDNAEYADTIRAVWP